MTDEPPESLAGRPHDAPPASLRGTIFRHSYSEVLLFLKHEDDKINRVLTALAFLTAAAVTLYIFSRGMKPPETLGLHGSALTAADFFFASFIIGLALALLAAIAALDPTSFYPRFIGAAEEPESILYYRSIGQVAFPPGSALAERYADGRARWEAIGESSEPELEGMLVASFHEDARRLSHRAYHKVYRFTECNAFVNLAVMSLALLGIARLEMASTSLRWGIIATMLAVYSWAPLYEPTQRVLTAASGPTSLLRIDARDANSGVAAVQTASRRSAKNANTKRLVNRRQRGKRKLLTTVALKSSGRPVWVRVRDAGGNYSAWRRAR